MDIEKIKEYTGADNDFIIVLFDKFLGHLDSDLEELENASQTLSLNALRSKTHAMLSSARIFFLEDIIELSSKIENDCADKNKTDIKQDVSRLIELYKKARVDIENWKSASEA